MNTTDLTGTVGVSLLLIAFVLNLFFKISKDGFLYLSLNLMGASIACLASIFLVYWPFIILEGVWALFSGFAVWRLLMKKGKSPAS